MSIDDTELVFGEKPREQKLAEEYTHVEDPRIKGAKKTAEGIGEAAYGVYEDFAKSLSPEAYFEALYGYKPDGSPSEMLQTERLMTVVPFLPGVIGKAPKGALRSGAGRTEPVTPGKNTKTTFPLETRMTTPTLDSIPVDDRGMFSVGELRSAINRSGVTGPDKKAIELTLREYENMYGGKLPKKLRRDTFAEQLESSLPVSKMKSMDEYRDYDASNQVVNRGSNNTTSLHNIEGEVDSSYRDHFGKDNIAHTRYFDEGNNRYIVEVQSDFFQKAPTNSQLKTNAIGGDWKDYAMSNMDAIIDNRVEGLINRPNAIDMGSEYLNDEGVSADYIRQKFSSAYLTYSKNLSENGSQYIDRVREYLKNKVALYTSPERWRNAGVNIDPALAKRRAARATIELEALDAVEEVYNWYLRDRTVAPEGAVTDQEKFDLLKSTRKRWHEKVIQDEINMAVNEGVDKVHFPTLMTANRVEGWGSVTDFAQAPRQTFSPQDILESSENTDNFFMEGNPRGVDIDFTRYREEFLNPSEYLSNKAVQMETDFYNGKRFTPESVALSNKYYTEIKDYMEKAINEGVISENDLAYSLFKSDQNKYLESMDAYNSTNDIEKAEESMTFLTGMAYFLNSGVKKNRFSTRQIVEDSDPEERIYKHLLSTKGSPRKDFSALAKFYHETLPGYLKERYGNSYKGIVEGPNGQKYHQIDLKTGTDRPGTTVFRQPGMAPNAPAMVNQEEEKAPPGLDK